MTRSNSLVPSIPRLFRDLERQLAPSIFHAPRHRGWPSLFQEPVLWPASTMIDQSAMLPSINVSETKDALRVEAELPGVKKEDLSVRIVDGTLVVKGRTESEREASSFSGEEKTDEQGAAGDAAPRYWVVERTEGEYQRAVRLPDNVDKLKIKAEYRDGVLHVTMPKVPEAEQQDKGDQEEPGVKVEVQ